MAGSAQYTAVLDANVLYPALLRDVLLILADADLYSAKWSAHIRDEWTRSLLRDRPGMEAQIAAADAIVTWNEKDFPKEILDPFGVEVQTPDEFVLNQLMLEKVAALSALKRMRERWARPQYDAVALVALLEKRGLPQTAAHLRDVVTLI